MSENVVTRDPLVAAITTALAEPFAASEVKFKPQMIKNNRCLAMAYIDARLIQDRLDDVLGVENWEDSYRILPDGSVMCRLKVKLGDRWITKTDVGSPSEQPDGGDRLKAAFSDALKRAAVKFGIGRYLYRLSASWVDYDPTQKKIAQTPRLPDWALPTKKPAAKPEPTKASVKPAPGADAGGEGRPDAKVCKGLPATGRELYTRLTEYEKGLVKNSVCRPGELVNHVTKSGVANGFPPKLVDWATQHMQFAADAVNSFEQNARQHAAAV